MSFKNREDSFFLQQHIINYWISLSFTFYNILYNLRLPKLYPSHPHLSKNVLATGILIQKYTLLRSQSYNYVS